MADFPSSVPAFTDLNPAATLAANNHAARHNKVHAEVYAIAAKVGTTSSVDTSSLDYKVSLVMGAAKAETNANKDTDTALAANSDTKYPSQKAVKAYIDSSIATAITAAKAALWPVGSVYSNAGVSTNPATLLGFGTWTAWGTGRVPVGVDPGQVEFDGLEETGGEKTHVLTIPEMPAHVHSRGRGNDNNLGFAADQYGWQATDDYSGTFNTSSTGGDGAHNNLQPYITVYMWKRTA